MVGKITIKETVNLKRAVEIRREIKSFFKNNPEGKLQLHFGGYTRLGKKTSDEIFKKLVKDKGFDWNRYGNSITTYAIHIFDQQTIGQSIQDGEE